MRHFTKKGFVAFLVIILIFSITTTPISAKTQLTNGIKSEKLKQSDIKVGEIQTLKELGYSEEEIEQAIEDSEEIGKYIEIDQDFNFYFNEDEAIESGVNKQLVEETKKDIEKTREQTIKSNKDIEVQALCKGTTAYYAPQMMTLLDNCVTNSITTAIAGGALLTTIAGMLIAAIPGAGFAGAQIGIAGALIGYGAYLIDSKNDGAGIFIIRGDEIYPQPWL